MTSKRVASAAAVAIGLLWIIPSPAISRPAETEMVEALTAHRVEEAYEARVLELLAVNGPYIEQPAAPVVSSGVRPAPRVSTFPAQIEQWRPLIARFFSNVDKALRVMQCETAGTGDPDIVNYEGSGASGLFQHMPQFWDERSAAAGYGGASIFDPEANVAVAAYLVDRDGWRHWPHCGKR